MKKIFLTFALIAGFTLIGFSQQNADLLKGNKWYAIGDVFGESITLTKTAPAKSDWDATFGKKGAMNFCYTVKSALMNPQGVEIKVGEYYCDALYTAELKGNVLHIMYPLLDLYFNVKPLQNGDLLLAKITSEVANGAASAK